CRPSCASRSRISSSTIRISKRASGSRSSNGSTSLGRKSSCSRRSSELRTSKGVALSGKVPHQAEPEPKPANRKRYGKDDVERRQPQLPAVVEQYGVERESRKGRVTPKYARRQEQSPVLGDATLKGEVADEQAHHQRSAHVLEKRRIVEAGAQHASDRDIDA